MSKQLKLRRGTTAQHSTFTGASGEVTVDTDKKTVVVHDGTTPGGSPVSTPTATETLTNKTLTNPTINGFTGSTAIVNLGSGQFYKDSSGNVGIGTSSPSNKLHVIGDVLSQGRGNTYGYKLPDWRIYNSSTGNALVFDDYTNERMRIDSSGNLLVNTTSATGSAKFVVAADTTTANPMAVSNTRSTASTDYSILFYRNGSVVGSVQTSLSATSYVTSSDYRLKENIAPMTGALDKVAQLKPCTYNWKLDGEAGQGFIAHELQEVVPECVTGEKDAVDADGNPQYQGIDTSFLVATLTAAIQEQQAIIEQLKADVETLKQGGV
jgi:hypothetical protein